MRRILLTLIVLTACTYPVAAKELLIKWHGQSYFEIRTTAGTTIALDPHNLDAYGDRPVTADLLLITHFHVDHAIPAQITNLRTTKILYGLKNKDGLAGNRRNDEFADLDEKFKDVRIRSLGSYHDNLQGMQRGKNSIFVLEVDGLRIVHLGDLGHPLTDSLRKKIGQVDILMVPVGGTYTINGSEAREVVEQLNPRRYVIPMHYGTRVYDALLGPDEFLEEQDPKFVKTTKLNELNVDPESAPRKKPIIAVLGYEQKDAPKEK